MEELIEEAYRIILEMEQKSRELLKAAAAVIPEGAGRTVMERLALEQSEIVAQIQERTSVLVGGMTDAKEFIVQRGGVEQSAERRLFDLLDEAMQYKRATVDQYHILLRTFRDPALCQVFEWAVSLSESMLQRMSGESRQAEQSMQRPRVYRRVKRTHLENSLLKQRPPNQHSQLFIALQDGGRRSPL